MSNLLVSWEEKRTSAQSERLQNSVREAGWESCGTRVCFILTMRQMTPSPADLCTITKRRISMMRRENFWDTRTHNITATGQKKKPQLTSSVLHILAKTFEPFKGRRSGGKSGGQESVAVSLRAWMEGWWTKPQIVSTSPWCLHWSLSLGKPRDWDVRV